MYEQYFGFDSKPFQLNPDPAFFFASAGHQRARAYLQYGLHKGEGFILITGEIGAGKTTLMRGLLDQIDRDAMFPVEITSTQVHADDFLRLLAAELGLQVSDLDKASMLNLIGNELEKNYEDGRRTLVLIDEAQNLTRDALEELRMLTNFNVGNRTVIQALLLGQPELRETMQRGDMTQFRQRVVASYHLGPLTAQETKRYIGYRLKKVGWKGSPRFSSNVLGRIHEVSGGLPRQINSLCDRLLLTTYLNESDVVSTKFFDDTIEEMNAEAVSVAREPAENDFAFQAPGQYESVSSATRSSWFTDISDRLRKLEVISSRITKDIARVNARLAGEGDKPVNG